MEGSVLVIVFLVALIVLGAGLRASDVMVRIQLVKVFRQDDTFLDVATLWCFV